MLIRNVGLIYIFAFLGGCGEELAPDVEEAAVLYPNVFEDKRPIPSGVFEFSEGAAHIEVRSPPFGHQTNLAQVSVEGQVNQVKSLKSLTVNGKPVLLDADGNFQTSQGLHVGLNKVEVVAESSDGSTWNTTRSVLRGDFESFDHTIQNAILAEIDTGYLSELEDLVRDQILSTDIMSYLDDDLIYGRGGCSTSLWLRSLSIDDADVTISAGDDRIDFRAIVSDMHLSIKARAARDTFFGCIRDTKNGSVDIPSITLSGTIGLQTNSSETRVFSRVSNIQVEVPRVRYNIRGLNDRIERHLVGNIQPTVESALHRSMNDVIPDLIEPEMNALLASELTHPMPMFGMSATFRPSSVRIDRSRIRIESSLTIQSEHAMPSDRMIVASLPPSLSSHRLPPSADVRVGFNLDAANVLLANLWQARVFEFDINERRFAGMELSLPAGIEQFKLNPLLPPRLSIVDGKLVVTAADLSVVAKGGEQLTLKASTITKISIRTVRTRDHKLQFAKTNQSTEATIVEGAESGLSEGVMSVVFELAANHLVDRVNEALRRVSLPLMSELSGSLSFGAEGQSLYVEGNL